MKQDRITNRQDLLRYSLFRYRLIILQSLSPFISRPFFRCPVLHNNGAMQMHLPWPPRMQSLLCFSTHHSNVNRSFDYVKSYNWLPPREKYRMPRWQPSISDENKCDDIFAKSISITILLRCYGKLSFFSHASHLMILHDDVHETNCQRCAAKDYFWISDNICHAIFCVVIVLKGLHTFDRSKTRSKLMNFYRGKILYYLYYYQKMKLYVL